MFASAACAFESIGAASSAVQEIMQRGVQLGCVELLDEVMIRAGELVARCCLARVAACHHATAVNKYAGFQLAEKPTLFFKFAGSPASVSAS